MPIDNLPIVNDLASFALVVVGYEESNAPK